MLAVLLGLGVYLYVPLAAGNASPVNWGDARTMEGFLWLVSGNPYQDYVFGAPLEFWGVRALAWADLMLGTFNGLGIVLGFAGFWWLARKDWQLALCLTASFVAVSLYATFNAASDSFVFLLPTFFVFALWLALGVRLLYTEVLLPRIAAGRTAKAAWTIMAGLTVLLIILIPGVAVARVYPEREGVSLNLRNDTEAADYGREALAVVEPGIIIIAHSDRPIFSLWYQRYVTGKGSTVTVIAQDLLRFGWYQRQLNAREPGLLPGGQPEGDRPATELALLETQLGRRAIYVTWEDSVLAGYDLIPTGRLFRVTENGG